ncbi:MAG: hypothetical protein ABIQ18_05275 [Umezawaea sp.]
MITGEIAMHRKLHFLLALTSLQIVLVSVNRLSGLTLSYVAPNEFLRWIDLLNMVLGFVSVLVYFLLARHLVDVSDRPRTSAHRALDVVFVVGAYLYASSYGSHEVTNYLHERFCWTSTTDLCRIIGYNDDGFSHYLFFAGFIVLNLVVMLTQAVSPDDRPSSALDNVLVVVNALFISTGIVANLGFEVIGLDLYVVAAVAVLAVVLLRRHPRQLVLRYYAVAYVVGLVATVAIKSIMGT